MKKNLIIFLTNISLFFILYFIFLYSKDIKENILYAINIWTNTLIPSIFPFLLISSLLINYGFVEIISKIFGNIINKIYRINKNASFAVITSMFTGFPTGSKYVNDLLKENKITNDEANNLIAYTSFSNPLFVISVIGETLLQNKKDGIIIYIIHLISGLITGLFFRNIKNTNDYKESKKEKKESFIKSLKESIKESFNILVNILGIMIYFFIIITIIDNLFKENIFLILIKSILEITIGSTLIANYNIKRKLKIALLGMIISFNGLSIHMQTKSIIDETQIKYSNYLKGRIIHALLCFILLLIFYSI